MCLQVPQCYNLRNLFVCTHFIIVKIKLKKALYCEAAVAVLKNSGAVASSPQPQEKRVLGNQCLSSQFLWESLKYQPERNILNKLIMCYTGRFPQSGIVRKEVRVLQDT